MQTTVFTGHKFIAGKRTFGKGTVKLFTKTGDRTVTY